MFRKIIAALLIVAALAAASGAVPELIQNIAYACTVEVDC
jgi:hypothetical protein